MKTIGKKHYKQYTLKQVLGTGSFGKVYHSPPYAIKQMCFQGMSPFLVNTLKNQIKILDKIHHKNIVRLVDHFYEGPNVYLVMQYCQMDLSKYLKKNNKKLPEDKAIDILKQILCGFKELVKNQVIHRDLKPANILVNSKGQFKLADFGFAKFVNHYDSKLLYSIVGTPLYMAPQILAKKQYTTKCDIWSIGFIFYQMLTGTFPWMGVSESDLLKNINNRPLNIPNNLSQFTATMIYKMLTVNQKQRISWDELFQNFLTPEPKLIKKQAPPKSMPKIDLFKGKQNIRTEQTPRDNQQKMIEPKQRQRIHTQDKNKHKKILTNCNLSPEKKPIPAKNGSPVKSNRAKSQRKKQNNLDVDFIMCYENVFTDLMEIQLQRLFDEQTAHRICRNLSGKMPVADYNKFERALEHFNNQFENCCRKIWNFQHH